MTDEVSANPRTRRITGEGWGLRADRVEVAGGGRWRAVVGVRRDLSLLVTREGQGHELDVEAWAAEPGNSDGVAVIDLGDGDIRLARVPLCSCGDRGCGNAGVQFARRLPGHELPALVEVLRGLPWARTVPARENVLRGSGLAALAERESGYPPGSYLFAPGTGEVFPLP